MKRRGRDTGLHTGVGAPSPTSCSSAHRRRRLLSQTAARRFTRMEADPMPVLTPRPADTPTPTSPRRTRRSVVRVDPFDGDRAHGPSENIPPRPLAATTVCVGLDVHKRATQVCALDAQGIVVDERRIATTRRGLASLFAHQPRWRLVLVLKTAMFTTPRGLLPRLRSTVTPRTRHRC